MNKGICSYKPKCFKYLYIDKVKNNIDNILNFLEDCFGFEYIYNANPYHQYIHFFMPRDNVFNNDERIEIITRSVFLVFIQDKKGNNKIEVYTEKQFNNIFNIEQQK